MLTGLSIVAENGDSLEIAMPGGSDGYLVESINGLGPVPVTHISTSYGQLDGENHQHSRRDKRTIELEILLTKDYYYTTIEDRRFFLDKWFVPKQALTFRIEDSRFGEVTTVARVEDVDSPIFTSDPYYQVTLVCENPDLVSSITMEQEIALAVTNIGNTAGEIEIHYTGTIATGFLLEMTKWTGGSSNTLIRNRPGIGRSQNILIPGTIPSGNRLRLSTHERNKFVQYLTPTGGIQPGLGTISNDSEWIKLQPGSNYIRVSTSSPAGKLAKLTYNILYGGL